jgi:hypothetical protein
MYLVSQFGNRGMGLAGIFVYFFFSSKHQVADITQFLFKKHNGANFQYVKINTM